MSYITSLSNTWKRPVSVSTALKLKQDVQATPVSQSSTSMNPRSAWMDEYYMRLTKYYRR